MNTFNMKQWLTENKVGPYAKTKLNESHEGNDKWLQDFHDLVDKVGLKPWEKHQILNIPSDQIISMYADEGTTPAKALDNVIKALSHSAHESKESIKEDSEVGNSQSMSEYEFDINGEEYLISMDVNWRGMWRTDDGELDDLTYQVEIRDLAKAAGDEYVPVTDEQEKAMVKKELETNPELEKQIFDSLDLSAGERIFEKDETDEQIGVGYAMITKPSDPKY